MTFSLTRRGMLAACIGSSAFCVLPAGRSAAGNAEACPDLGLAEIASGVWVHTSWHMLENSTCYSSNGMIVVGKSRVLLVDTAWTPVQTTSLLEQLKPLRAAPFPLAPPKQMNLFITHHHDDRMGGIGVTTSRGIPSYAFPQTVEEAEQKSMGAIAFALPEEHFAFDLGGRVVEVFYPGPGHTSDNAVVYDRSSATLFGGCLVRAADTDNLGSTNGASVPQWGASLGRVAERYPDARIVIPGHGTVGGLELLMHTLDLIGN